MVMGMREKRAMVHMMKVKTPTVVILDSMAMLGMTMWMTTRRMMVEKPVKRTMM